MFCAKVNALIFHTEKLKSGWTVVAQGIRLHYIFFLPLLVLILVRKSFHEQLSIYLSSPSMLHAFYFWGIQRVLTDCSLRACLPFCGSVKKWMYPSLVPDIDMFNVYSALDIIFLLILFWEKCHLNRILIILSLFQRECSGEISFWLNSAGYYHKTH